jgi:hypothetical protein
MHEDYQLAYCPIVHITSLAFVDDAFENARLTPELLHKLRVPGRLHVLPCHSKRACGIYLFFEAPSGSYLAFLPISRGSCYIVRLMTL